MVIPHSHAHQKKRKHRQLKRYAKGQYHTKKEREVFSDPDRRRDSHNLVLLDEIPKRYGEDDSITEIGPADKEQRRAQNKGNYQFSFAASQTRRDKAPDLQEQVRTRENQAAQNRDFYFDEKSFGDAGSDQALARRQLRL